MTRPQMVGKRAHGFKQKGDKLGPESGTVEAKAMFTSPALRAILGKDLVKGFLDRKPQELSRKNASRSEHLGEQTETG